MMIDSKKIGIATFHYADNYGAVLQAYALLNTINRFEGCNVELINYVPKGYVIYPYEATPMGICNMKKKRKQYECFLKERCDIHTPMVDCISGKDYDYCCVGSDQVWNMSFRENATQEYLLPNIDKSVKCFSYAASIGREISDNEIQYFYQYLQHFASISVREKSALYSLEKIGITEAEISLDPSLLLSEYDYEGLIEEPPSMPSDFIFFFSYPIGEEVRRYAPFVNMLARKYNLQIKHSVVGANEGLFVPDMGTMIYEGIGEFLWYMKHARIVVTTSYHGAIFGYIFNRPTYVICRGNGKERFEQLSSILGLDEYFVDDNWMFKSWNIDDYKISKDNLDKWKNKSIEYLKRSLYV